MNIFIILFKVNFNDLSNKPFDGESAFVRCYYPAEQFETAIEKSIEKLLEDKYQIDEILSDIYQMDSSDWSQHIEDQWPELVEMMYSQKEFEAQINKGTVVYGPFGTY